MMLLRVEGSLLLNLDCHHLYPCFSLSDHEEFFLSINVVPYVICNHLIYIFTL